MSVDLDRLKYRDPVLRDMFTALDVSLIVPLVFAIEGYQADKAKLRLAVLTVVVAATAGIIVGVTLGVTVGLWQLGLRSGLGILVRWGTLYEESEIPRRQLESLRGLLRRCHSFILSR